MAKTTKLIVNRPVVNKMAKGSAVRVTAIKPAGKLSAAKGAIKAGKSGKGC